MVPYQFFYPLLWTYIVHFHTLCSFICCTFQTLYSFICYTFHMLLCHQINCPYIQTQTKLKTASNAIITNGIKNGRRYELTLLQLPSPNATYKVKLIKIMNTRVQYVKRNQHEFTNLPHDDFGRNSRNLVSFHGNISSCYGSPMAVFDGHSKVARQQLTKRLKTKYQLI